MITQSQLAELSTVVTAEHEQEDPAAGASGIGLTRAAQVFLAERRRMFQIAYRVTGDASDADDVVQDAWLRWQHTDRGAIRNPAAFLTTTTTRLAINLIQSARHRHELVTDALPMDRCDPAGDPASLLDQTMIIEATSWFLMTRLSPSELAAYLLRKAFDLPYDGIADVLQTTAPNSRQLVRRAQLALTGGRERPVDAAAHGRLVAAFRTATNTGRLTQLTNLLAEAGRPRHNRSAQRHKAPRDRESAGMTFVAA